MAGVYIHIPFCASRCIYCGFYSTVLLEYRRRYVDAVCHEMVLRQGYLPDESLIETIYLGGGTPSQLSGEELRLLFDNINKVYALSPTPEVTMECNPDDITPDYAATLGRLPINRVSMGAQTFDDARLAFLHRRHTAADVSRAVNLLRKAGIGNISIDLMFGFPGETLDDWQRDIEAALSLCVEHISAYSLMYEEGTVLYDALKRGKLQATSSDGSISPSKPIDEELSLKMYETLIDSLARAGYEQYEISNFAWAKAGSMKGETISDYCSHHNSSYWQAIPYIGLGAAAHSYDGRSRQWNVSNLLHYMTAIEQRKVPFEREILDDDTRYNDLITTALRTREGIRLTALQPKYRDYLLKNARTSLRSGHLVIDGDSIHLTRSGLFVSNSVMSDLIWI